MTAQRVFLTSDPFIRLNDGKEWRQRGHWPARWINVPGAEPPFAAAFRLPFTLERGATARIHVTADERYELFLDGARLGRGPERGDPLHWFYESFDLALGAGPHVLSARVLALGPLAAEYQMSAHPGFLLAAEGEFTGLLSTGLAPWECRLLSGVEFITPVTAFWRDWRTRVDAQAYPWGAERGLGDGWTAPLVKFPGVGRIIDWAFAGQHRLQPAALPPMLETPFRAGRVRFAAGAPGFNAIEQPVSAGIHDEDVARAWQGLLDGRGEVTVPARSVKRVIIDLEEYYCAFPELVTSGGEGARVRVSWAESLTASPNPWDANKGHRGEIEGKFFCGNGDEYLPAGQRRAWQPCWWMAGRYIEIVVETRDTSLVIHAFNLYETRYPLENGSAFHSSDPRIDSVIPLAVRGLQSCARDSYFDTPYYEEHTYAGDTRLECLVTYVLTRDDRLPRKVLAMFDASRMPDGMTQSRYPCRATQIIPAWSLWWIGMVNEYAFWRGRDDLVRQLLPGVRQTLEAFSRSLGEDGLLYGPEGWNNLDWSPGWAAEAGMPPDAVYGPNGTLNWQLAYVLTLAAQLEDHFGEPEMAARDRRWAQELAERITQAFWDEGRSLFADDRARARFSEHAQALAILSGLLSPDMQARVGVGLVKNEGLDQASYHFLHYIIEALRVLGRADEILTRLRWWHDRMVVKGLKTPLEAFEPSRSDCHAWSSHPYYHFFASVLGIRPASPGFTSVEITPLLGDLDHAEGSLVHPGGGSIVAAFRQEAGRLTGSVALPAGVSGVLRVNGHAIDLHPGEQSF